MPKNILIVDDEINTREGLARALRGSQYHVFLAESADAARTILEKESIDLMLSDIRMPGEDGLSLLASVHERYPDILCILLTAYGTVETAVEAMRKGAKDFLTKPVQLDDLEAKLERAFRERDQARRIQTLEAENSHLRERLGEQFGLQNITGTSAVMQSVFKRVRQAANSSATVLIQGPSGTGKELIANALHQLSPRAAGPFVAVNCSALTPTLLESELFGHEAHAFTDAGDRTVPGRFELANGGTIFLDEISEIDTSVQVKLLRVLQEHTFERVGGQTPVHSDFRLIAATNRDLEQCVQNGTFRQDLYYRLHVIDIQMPPLAERTGDIPLLCQRFLREFAHRDQRSITGFSPDAMALLEAYPWPGNVRELRNTIERMVVLASGEMLTVDDLPAEIRSVAGAAVPTTPAPPKPVAPTDPTFVPPSSGTLADTEKATILATLQSVGYNRSKTAAILNISRRTLQRKLKEWGITAHDA